MSEQTIKRWNDIPLECPLVGSSSHLKRERPVEESDDDDDVSLVSRSPSPPRDAMDVDESSIHQYDEFVRRPAREVITVDTKIKPTNKGFALLTRLGWREGQPVGLNADGRTEPIPFHVKSDMTGLGKTIQDFQMIETTVSQRRELDSERQRRETEEQRKLREDSVVRKSVLEAELSSTLKAFYCELCDKQFKTITQYDEHTNSYAHHHKARIKDMQANSRIKLQEDIDKRHEKERKREERDLRKIAAASGVKMSFNVTPASTPSEPVSVERTPVEPPKRGGWAAVSNVPSNPTSSTNGFRGSGWASINAGPSAPQPPSNPAPPLPAEPNVYFQPPPPPPPNFPPPTTPPIHTPSFHAAGWASLDTGSSQPVPPSQLCVPQSSSTVSSSALGWSQSSFAPMWPTDAAVSPPPPSNLTSSTSLSSLPSSSTQSSWRQFQKGMGSKK